MLDARSLAALFLLAPAALATDYDETVDGDLSDDGLNPDAIVLTDGSNLVRATQQGDPRDIDFLSVTVPAGKQLASCTVVDYVAGSANLMFLGVVSGPVFMSDPDATAPGDLLGGEVFGSGSVGEDILFDIGTFGGTQGFLPPLPAGTYTWWFNQTGPASTVELDLVVEDVPPIRAFCFGDGSVAPCPCNNDSFFASGEGCANSLAQGALLTTTGTNAVAADDLVFTVAQAIPNQPSLLVQGASTIQAPFKDGLLCAGSPTDRLEFFFLDGAGGGSTSSSIVSEGSVAPGQTRYYQAWYRDPGGVSPCGTGSNFTQGVVVDWN